VNGWETLAQSIAAHAMNAAIVGLVLVGALWVALRVFGKQSSRARFAVWFLGLLTVAALPLLFAQRASSGSGSELVALPSAWATYFIGLWAFGAGAGLLRIGSGLVRLRQLRRNAVAIDATSFSATTVAKLQNNTNGRRVGLYHSDEVSVPMVIGFVRPAVILPSELVPQLSEEERGVIVLHEMAHIRRWDDWTNLVQKIVKAIFFFHPAVWWIDNRLSLEREMACDEMVLEQSPGAKAYAGFLIAFHEKLQNAGAPALVQALVSRVSQLAARVTQILETNRAKKSRVPVLAASAALLATLGVGPMLPELVSFGSAPALATNGVRTRQVSTSHIYENAVKVPTVEAPAKVINAAYHPAEAVPVPAAKVKVVRRQRPVHVKAIAEDVPVPRPMLVVYQSAQFDGATWTICVWSVDPVTNTTVQSFVLKI